MNVIKNDDGSVTIVFRSDGERAELIDSLFVGKWSAIKEGDKLSGRVLSELAYSL